MGLSVEDRFKFLAPAWLYYPQKLAQEARASEPELALLPRIAPAGRTAVDVGANRGIYSYALAAIAGRVEAFEPNPVLARFVRGKLGARIRIHEVALCERAGAATLFLPRNRAGVDLHLLASLTNPSANPSLMAHRHIKESVLIPVRTATLDDFDFVDVGFIKIDTEGAELEVLAGARRTIVRDRPNLLVELLTGAFADPFACIRQIAADFRYDPWICVAGRLFDAAVPEVRSLPVKTGNVVFTPIETRDATMASGLVQTVFPITDRK